MKKGNPTVVRRVVNNHIGALDAVGSEVIAWTDTPIGKNAAVTIISAMCKIACRRIPILRGRICE
jgi:hypothetical protein